MISDSEARRKAIKWKYEPEIPPLVYKKMKLTVPYVFTIGDIMIELYKAAMSIPGAKYRYRSVKIPASQYEAMRISSEWKV